MDRTELNNLMNSKNKIEENINDIKDKKSKIESGFQVISPSSSIDVKIAELKFDKQIAVLRKEQKNIEYKFQLGLENITEEEYAQKVKQNDEDTNNEIKLLDENIQLLQKQKQENDPYKKLGTKREKNKIKKERILTDIKSKKTQTVSRLVKTLLKTTAEAALAGTLSRLVHNKSTDANFKISKLDDMVERVNTQIDAIKTRYDIERAKVARNNAVRLLNDIESKLIKLEKLIKILEKIVSILLLVVKLVKIALKFVPVPGPKALLQIKLDKAERILTSILLIVTLAGLILKFLINLVRELRDRLKQIGNLLDEISTDENKLTPDDISKLLSSSNFGKLGLLDISYKGFRFAIKEEFDKKFVVQGHKRRYAVALNKDNSEVLKSDASFTLDPDQLIEQLKLQIDTLDLSP